MTPRHILGLVLVVESLIFGAATWQIDVQSASYYLITAGVSVAMMAIGVLLMCGPRRRQADAETQLPTPYPSVAVRTEVRVGKLTIVDENHALSLSLQ